MPIIGKEKASTEYWTDSAQWYADSLKNDYHRHRLAVIDHLIPEELYGPGKRIFDFGCGDAVHFPRFLKAGATIEGVDISLEMITFAKQHLAKEGMDAELAQVGSVESMARVPDRSMDAVISFNVLAYLTDAEEKAFYDEAARIVKPGGHLIVTHSNELFDMFTLNRYTVNFFNRHFIRDTKTQDVRGLLTQAGKPEQHAEYNVRENPLNYRYKLQRYGFEEVAQAFINHHDAPPLLLTGDKTYPDTLSVPEEDQWKLMFTCSTYGSRARKA